jgi:hypothetical protein
MDQVIDQSPTHPRSITIFRLYRDSFYAYYSIALIGFFIQFVYVEKVRKKKQI